jgi:hypothetical protein
MKRDRVRNVEAPNARQENHHEIFTDALDLRRSRRDGALLWVGGGRAELHRLRPGPLDPLR